MLSLLLLPVMAAAQGQDAVATEKKALEGTWTVATVNDLTPDPVDYKYTFAGDKLTMDIGGNRVSMRIKLDPSRTPKQIDILGGEHPLKGIYEIKGNAMRLCLGKERPDTFKVPPDGAYLKLTRARP
jgi:uncharacterized protein (TIGR03067 family)